MVEEIVATLRIGDNAAMARAFPIRIGRENRIERILLPGTEQALRSRHAESIVATPSAASGSRVEQIKPLPAPLHERPFNQIAFPIGIVAHDFLHLANQSGPVF